MTFHVRALRKFLGTNGTFERSTTAMNFLMAYQVAAEGEDFFTNVTCHGFWIRMCLFVVF